MADEERKNIWDIPGVGQLVAGIKTDLMKCNLDETVVHVTFPPGTSQQRSTQFATALRKEFPQKVRMAFTTPGVKINVNRPKTINFTLANIELSHQEALEQISQILKEKSDNIHITINNVTWKKREM